jgi:hypothetical protein
LKVPPKIASCCIQSRYSLREGKNSFTTNVITNVIL